MSKHAFNVLVFDHATQQLTSTRLILEANFAGEIDDFRIQSTGLGADFTQDLRDALGDQLDGSVPLEELDGYEFDGEFAGHFCYVTLEGSTLKEGDDE